jgi:hypothetical protein
MKPVKPSAWRPIANISVDDGPCRMKIKDALHRQGWAVVEHPTGFHLITAIAEIIEGAQPWLQPGLIVVDAVSRGCLGTTIAAGLRDLGIDIPIIIIRKPGDPTPINEDPHTHVVELANAATRIAELTLRWSPAFVTTRREPVHAQA